MAGLGCSGGGVLHRRPQYTTTEIPRLLPLGYLGSIGICNIRFLFWGVPGFCLGGSGHGRCRSEGWWMGWGWKLGRRRDKWFLG